MRLDRGIRVMLESHMTVGREVWAPNRDTGEWVASEILHYWGDDKVEVKPDPSMATITSEPSMLVWIVPRYSLRFRDSKRQGRDIPRDPAKNPSLKPKLKPGEVAKLGILSSGDIIGGKK